MNITLIGWIFIGLCIYSIIKNKDFLLDLLVFSSVFTAAAVVNIKITTTGIQPFYFVGTIWIIVTLIKYIRDGIVKEQIIHYIKRNNLIKALIIFGSSIILSEVCLLLFNNKFTFIDTKTLEYINASFGKSNITQPIFLLFMLVVAILLSIELNTRKKTVRCMKVFGIATLFALVWGIAQFSMFYMNITYPDWLFNNNISYLQLFNQMIYGVKRVNSIALEPSTFALNIIIFLSTVLTLWIGNYKVFKKKSQLILLIGIFLALICGILTTSTTALLGIFLIVIMLTIYVTIFSIKGGNLNKNKKKIGLFYIFVLISIIIVIILATQVFNMYWGTLLDTLKDITINKINLETGNERLNAVKTSLNIFELSPILGVGFGTFRSLDLTTNLLSNVGVLGLGSYLYIIVVSLKRIIKNRRSNETIALAFGITLIVSTIALLISIPDLIFGYYWIMIVVINVYFKEEVA